MSQVKKDLETINESKEMMRLLEADHEIRAKAGDIVGMVSQFAFLTLADPTSPTLAFSCYTEDLHSWIVETTDFILERCEDDELRLAVGRTVKYFEQRVGTPMGTLIEGILSDSEKNLKVL
jgi:hypothetical protein